MTVANRCISEPQVLEALLHGIDRGIEAHLAWNQRLLRCALLRESPGDDALQPDAHSLCQFGRWLVSHRHQVDTIDAPLVRGIDQSHQHMHAAARQLCHAVLQGEVAKAAHLDAYMEQQSAMVGMLNKLRLRVTEYSSRFDDLTGLPLRHGLDYCFRVRQMDAQRTGASLWVAVFDVDHFKRVNDLYGHAVGDVVLQQIARRLAAGLRETDLLIRFGGEEFLALFLVAEPQDVQVLAARVLESVSATPIVTPSNLSLALTVTAGLAQVHRDEPLVSATERADHALLLGKTQGRARFVLAPV